MKEMLVIERERRNKKKGNREEKEVEVMEVE